MCKCDSRGRQISEDGDGCWLEKNPCQILTGEITGTKIRGNWVDCESNGVKIIDCPGNYIFRVCKCDSAG